MTNIIKIEDTYINLDNVLFIKPARSSRPDFDFSPGAKNFQPTIEVTKINGEISRLFLGNVYMEAVRDFFVTENRELICTPY